MKAITGFLWKLCNYIDYVLELKRSFRDSNVKFPYFNIIYININKIIGRRPTAVGPLPVNKSHQSL